MLLHQFLADAAARTPDAIALIEPVRRTSYAELDRLANRYAHLFLSSGVTRGDRVVIALDNSAEMVGAYFGAMKAGGVAVPLPAGPRSDRLPAAIKDCAPRLCLIDAATARAVTAESPLAGVPAVFVHKAPRSLPAGAAAFRDMGAALQDCPDTPVSVRVIDLDLAAIIYTSGSTGEPRGVMLTHQNFVANARSIVAYLGLTSADRVMCVLPFHYVYGLSLLHTHLLAGASLVIDNRFAFPNVVLAAMKEHDVTGFAGVPSTFAILLHRSDLAQTPLPRLRYVTQAGGGMPPARIAEWLERGPAVPFFVMYGATEAAARLTYLPPDELREHLGSIGRPIPNVEVRVLTADGVVAAPGEVGELVARGSNISAGYWNNPEETRARFGPEGYRTGDLGYADAEGRLHLVGRAHDMMKVGANRVGAREIEDVLHEHPAILEAAVVPAPHDLLGEVPVAFVVLRGELDDPSQAVRAFCAGRLAVYKVPQRVVVLPEMPRLTGAGKLDRTALRAAAAAPAAPGGDRRT